MPTDKPTPCRPRLGVSACLLGEPVRYDGTDKRMALITEAFGRDCQLVPVCPEVAIGMGVPRRPIQLVGDPAAPHALDVNDPRRDLSDALRGYARELQRELGALDGLILKSRSPSCGLTSTPVFDRAGAQIATGAGLFAAALREQHPELPLIEEPELADAGRRAEFLRRVQAHHRGREGRC